MANPEVFEVKTTDCGGWLRSRGIVTMQHLDRIGTHQNSDGVVVIKITPGVGTPVVSPQICFEMEKAIKEAKVSEQRPEKPGITLINSRKRISRNCLCPCGSGAKFKRCCIKKIS